jgi:1-acyl-sn-glycerol-3-phosphate acyltransferase
MLMHGELAATIFLCLVALVVLVWVARALARPPLHPVQNAFMFLARLLTTFLWRTIRSPFPDLPGRGVVVVCNHRSSADPFFVQQATTRGIYWMVAREFVEHPAFRWFLERCEVIPVNRGGVDTAALKLVMRHLAIKRIVGMFPEGRINMTDQLFLPGRPGAAMVALKTGSVLVPCYIAGSPYRGVPWSPFLMPCTVRVFFGTPLDAAEHAERIVQGEDETVVAQELLLEVMRRMAALAGDREFQPSLAGRNWKPTAEELAEAIAAQSRRASRK